MQFKLLLFVALCLGKAIAAPTTETGGGGWGDHKCTAMEATYDDLGAIPLLPITPMKSPYKGLRYTNFNILGQGIDLLPGSLKPYSTPNSIYFSLLTQLGGGIATINVDKGSFDLISTRFGCSTILGLTRIPLDCTVVASSVTKDGLRKSTTMKFTKSETMESFSFPPNQFQELKQVSFVVTGQPLLDTTFAATFDNLKYCIRK